MRWPDGAQRGRLAGRDGGVVPVSEVVLAFTFEPVLWVLTWLRRWVPVLARLGRTIEGMARRAGGAEAGVPRWQRAAALASIIFFRSPAPAVGCRPGYLVTEGPAEIPTSTRAMFLNGRPPSVFRARVRGRRRSVAYGDGSSSRWSAH